MTGTRIRCADCECELKSGDLVYAEKGRVYCCGCATAFLLTPLDLPDEGDAADWEIKDRRCAAI